MYSRGYASGDLTAGVMSPYDAPRRHFQVFSRTTTSKTVPRTPVKAVGV